MKIGRWLCTVAVLLIMLFIFCLSAQPAEASRGLSNPIVAKLKAKVADSDVIPKHIKEAFLKSPSFWVRKMAHVSIYCMLGFVVYMALPTRKWTRGRCILLALGICMAYAIGDEWHQLYIPGRSGELRDVILDTSGALGGILVGWVIKKMASIKTR